MVRASSARRLLEFCDELSFDIFVQSRIYNLSVCKLVYLTSNLVKLVCFTFINSSIFCNWSIDFILFYSRAYSKINMSEISANCLHCDVNVYMYGICTLYMYTCILYHYKYRIHTWLHKNALVEFSNDLNPLD